MVAGLPIEAALHQQGRGWQTSRGKLGIWTPGSGVVISQLSGFGEAAFVDLIERSIGTSLERHPAVRVFFDVEQLSSYDSQLRVRLTAFFLSKKGLVVELHVLVRSKLVAMGVSVAALALGNLVTAHRTRAEFTQTLEAALSRTGVVSFSTRPPERRRWHAHRSWLSGLSLDTSG